MAYATIFLAAAVRGMWIATWPVLGRMAKSAMDPSDPGWAGSSVIVGGTAYLVILGLLLAVPGYVRPRSLLAVSALGLLVASLSGFAVPVAAPARYYGYLVMIGLVVSVVRWRAWGPPVDVQASAA